VPFLAGEVGVDPDRIACWGASYGGYMTTLTVTRAPEVCRAACPGTASRTGRSSRSRTSGARAPLLILQGTDDDGVLPAQGEALYDAMRQAARTVEYVAYTGEGHGFRQLGSQRDLYERVLAFLEAHNTFRGRDEDR